MAQQGSPPLRSDLLLTKGALKSLETGLMGATKMHPGSWPHPLRLRGLWWCLGDSGHPNTIGWTVWFGSELGEGETEPGA